jgi:hypothetical protein
MISMTPACAGQALAAAGHQLAEGLGFGIGDRPRRRPDGFGKMSDRRGVDAVGLGELAGGAGKSRIWRGLTTTSGSCAAAIALATTLS